MPSISKKLIINKHKKARDNEERNQEYHKSYADSRRKAKKNAIAVGDTVIVKQQRQNKLTTRYNDTPYVVISRKGTQILASDNKGHTIKRNVSHFKKVVIAANKSNEESETDSEIEGYKPKPRQENICENQDSDNEDRYQDLPQERPKRQKHIPQRFGTPIPSNIIGL